MTKRIAARGSVTITIGGFLVLCGAIGLSDIAAAAVGRTAGTFSVSPTGAATYTLPIWAPRGPGGVQPHIALVYDSQSGIGPEGVGWSLAGLSSIYRCNQTYAQDGAPAAITLTNADVFCLDGQRLRLTGGTYGADGSTYQTEIANFENVTAHSSAGNGPAYFTVQARNGVTYEYGNGSGGAQVLANGKSTAWMWMLDKVTDPSGNTMTISYTTATGTVVPATISWTLSSSGSSTYEYTMTFAYTSNAVQSTPTGYVAGTEVQNPDLLSSITLSYSGTAVKTYYLTYQPSPTTGRDELAQVQECAGSGTGNCLSPTAITYQSGSVGVSSSATTAVSSPPIENTISPINIIEFSALYDFNGDGYKDIIYQTAQGGDWYVQFGSPSGYGSPVDTGVSGELTQTVLFGDLLGTGEDGILADNGGTWWYYTWNGSSFVGQSTGLAYDSTMQQFALADYNGDGLPDLVELSENTSGATLYTRLNKSSGSTVSFNGTATTAYISSAPGEDFRAALVTPDINLGNVRNFHFEGNGLGDLFLETGFCVMLAAPYGGSICEPIIAPVALLSQPNGTFSGVAFGTSGAVDGITTYSTYFVNLNDDACTDMIGGNYEAVFSGCNGASGSSVQAQYEVVGVLDWNGDGRADLLETDGTNLYVQLSTGSGFAPAQELSIPYDSTCKYIPVDPTGDGLAVDRVVRTDFRAG